MNETAQAIDYSFASDTQLQELLLIEQSAKDRTWTAYREDRINDGVYERRKTKQEIIINEIIDEIARRKEAASLSSSA